MSTYGVTIVNGHAPIPGAGGAGLGSIATFEGDRARRSFGAPRVFAGSSELVTIARQGLGRLQNAADEARAQCEDRGVFQRGFEWLFDSTATDTICDRAAQLELELEDLIPRVDDPRTTDAQLLDILHLIDNAVDIRDLIELAESTEASHVLGEAVFDAPGTAAGWVVEGAGEVAEGLGRGILPAIPWWVWVGAAGVGAYKFGLIKRNGR